MPIPSRIGTDSPANILPSITHARGEYAAVGNIVGRRHERAASAEPSAYKAIACGPLLRERTLSRKTIPAVPYLLRRTGFLRRFLPIVLIVPGKSAEIRRVEKQGR
jgi:hypothetical protein